MIPLVALDALAAGDGIASRRLADALRDPGCCHIAAPGLFSAERRRDLFDAAAGFFALPETAKRTCALSAATALRGYVGDGEEFTEGVADRKESFEFAQERDAPRDRAPRIYDRLYGRNVWPTGPCAGAFEAALSLWSRTMDEVGDLLMRAVVRGEAGPDRGIDDPLLSGSCAHFSRMIFYRRAREGTPAGSRLAAHTDHCFVTLALESAPGLELRCEGRWIAPDHRHDCALVFPGELADLWSGGAVRACRHRVHDEALEGDRYSLTTFVLPDLDAILVPSYREGHAGSMPIRVGDREWERMRAIFAIEEAVR